MVKQYKLLRMTSEMKRDLIKQEKKKKVNNEKEKRMEKRRIKRKKLTSRS